MYGEFSGIVPKIKKNRHNMNYILLKIKFLFDMFVQCFLERTDSLDLRPLLLSSSSGNDKIRIKSYSESIDTLIIFIIFCQYS